MRLTSRDQNSFYRNNIFFLNEDGTMNENPRSIKPGKYTLQVDPTWHYFILTLDQELPEEEPPITNIFGREE